MKIKISQTVLFLSLSIFSVSALANCVMDNTGRYYCARYPGGVATYSAGQPVCGNGQCTIDQSGNLVCSTEPNGRAYKDSMGVKCDGICEHVTPARCEVRNHP